MDLHFLVKLKIRVFEKILMLEKRNSRNVTIDFYLLKKMHFLTLTSCYDKFNHTNMYQTLSESAVFCKRYDKTFWYVFRFTVLAAVPLQNANAKFHKVG